MTLGEMRSQLRRLLANLPATDFLIVANDDVAWLNDGVRDTVIQVVRNTGENLTLFPELSTSWSATTVAAQEYVAKPTDAYVITRIESYDVTPATRATKQTKRTLRKTNVPDLDKQDRATTDYPSMWAAEEDKALLWPIPSASYLTDLRIYGIKRDKILTAADAAVSYHINQIWHTAVVIRGAYYGALAKGWEKKADAMEDAWTKAIARASDPSALSTMGQAIELDFDLAFSRTDVTGGLS